MEQIACKECTSTDCHGCNLLRLEQMLKSGKLDALMDEKRGIKTGIDVRPVVRGKWLLADDGDGKICSICGTDYCDLVLPVLEWNYCPNCGADMRGEKQ